MRSFSLIVAGMIIGFLFNRFAPLGQAEICRTEPLKKLESPCKQLIALHEIHDLEGVMMASRYAIVIISKDDDSIEAHDRGLALRSTHLGFRSMEWKGSDCLQVTVSGSTRGEEREWLSYTPVVDVGGQSVRVNLVVEQ